MARVYHWRKPPDDHFQHLFEAHAKTSVCGRVKFSGPKSENFDPEKRGGRGGHGFLCPKCRVVARRSALS